MAARLTSLPALARPGASLRLARSQPRRVAIPAPPLVTPSPPHLRLFRVRAKSEEHDSHMGDPDRRAIDKSEWIEAEAFGPVSAYCSAAPLAAATPDTPLGEIMHHFEEFTGRPRAPCDACRASLSSCQCTQACRCSTNTDAPSAWSARKTSARICSSTAMTRRAFPCPSRR